MDNKVLRNEVALRCGDVMYHEFDKDIYSRALLRANRMIARKYKIITRFAEFVNTIPIPNNLSESEEQTYLDSKYNEDVLFHFPSFVTEHRFVVNGREYFKVDKVEANSYQYRFYYDQNNWYYNYSPRSKSDKIQIEYSSDINIEDYEIEELEPIIPTQYNEEIIALTVVEMSKIGIAKYHDSKLGEKYAALFKIYSKDPRDRDPNLIKNNTWVQMKPWSPY